MRTAYVLAGLSTAVSAASNPGVCSTGIVGLLLPLSSYAPAQSYCSSKYPPQRTTFTSTATALTQTSSQTITITSSVTQTTSTTFTSTATVTSTSTITDSSTPQKRDAYDGQRDQRDAARRRKKRAATVTPRAAAVIDPRAGLFSVLTAAISSDVSKLCSCIEPTISTTITATPVPSTSIIIMTSTVTTTNTLTLSATTTITTTSVTTTTVPAPTCTNNKDLPGTSSTCDYYQYCEQSLVGTTSGDSTTQADERSCLSLCDAVNRYKNVNCRGYSFNYNTGSCQLYSVVNAAVNAVGVRSGGWWYCRAPS